MISLRNNVLISNEFIDYLFAIVGIIISILSLKSFIVSVKGQVSQCQSELTCRFSRLVIFWTVIVINAILITLFLLKGVYVVSAGGLDISMYVVFFCLLRAVIDINYNKVDLVLLDVCKLELTMYRTLGVIAEFMVILSLIVYII